MKNLLNGILGAIMPRHSPVGTGTNKAAPRKRPTYNGTLPAYPPSNEGIPAISPREIVEANQDLVARIRTECGMTDEEYTKYYGRVLINYAAYIHLLPATRGGFYRGVGGLYRLGLDLAYYCLRASGGTMFAGREEPGRRRELEKRWRYAAFLAGLLGETYRAFTDVKVVSPTGEEWKGYIQGLDDWLSANDWDSYYLNWGGPKGTDEQKKSANASIVSLLLPPGCIQYLHDGSEEIVTTFLSVISGTIPRTERVHLNEIVIKTRDQIIARDVARQPELYGQYVVGTHAEPLLLDIMRELVQEGTWTVNERKSRLWYGAEGLFLVWDTAAKEIQTKIRQKGLTGLPSSPAVLLETLCRAGVFTETPSRHYTISNPESGRELAAVKLVAPSSILSDPDLAPLGIRLVKTEVETERKPAADEEKQREEAKTIQEAPAPSLDGELQTEEVGLAHGVELSQKAQEHKVMPVMPEIAEQNNHEPGDAPEGGAELGGNAAELFKAIAEDAASKRGIATRIGVGVAIKADDFGSYGVPTQPVLEELRANGWLYTDPETPDRNMVNVDINGKTERAVVITAEFAKRVGL